MFKLKKTYTIEFKKVKHYDYSRIGIILGQCSIISTNAILKRLISFCSKNNIELKKFYDDEYDYKSSYIKIKGTKEDYQKVISFLTSNGLEDDIKIKNLKW